MLPVFEDRLKERESEWEKNINRKPRMLKQRRKLMFNLAYFQAV
jgi:hypothetical protein